MLTEDMRVLLRVFTQTISNMESDDPPNYSSSTDTSPHVLSPSKTSVRVLRTHVSQPRTLRPYKQRHAYLLPNSPSACLRKPNLDENAARSRIPLRRSHFTCQVYNKTHILAGGDEVGARVPRTFYFLWRARPIQPGGQS